MKDRKLKASTLQGYYAKIRAFFGWLKAEGYIRESPVDYIAEPKVKRKTPVYLTREQAKSLIATTEADVILGKAQPWLPDMVRVALGTGFRRAELCALRWRDVSFDEGRVYARGYVRKDSEGKVVYEHRTKSGHDRAVPLLPLAREALERLHAARTNEDEEETVFVGTRGAPLHGNFVGEEFRISASGPASRSGSRSTRSATPSPVARNPGRPAPARAGVPRDARFGRPRATPPRSGPGPRGRGSRDGRALAGSLVLTVRQLPVARNLSRVVKSTSSGPHSGADAECC